MSLDETPSPVAYAKNDERVVNFVEQADIEPQPSDQSASNSITDLPSGPRNVVHNNQEVSLPTGTKDAKLGQRNPKTKFGNGKSDNYQSIRGHRNYRHLPPPPPPPPSSIRPPPTTIRVPPPPPPPPPAPPSAEIKISRMPNSDFAQLQTFSAVEILLETPRVSMHIRRKKRASSDASNDQDEIQVQPVIKPNPKKIRIRTNKLLDLLEDLAEAKGRSFIAGSAAIVFYYPFKFLIALEPDIRDKLQELEQQAKEDGFQNDDNEKVAEQEIDRDAYVDRVEDPQVKVANDALKDDEKEVEKDVARAMEGEKEECTAKDTDIITEDKVEHDARDDSKDIEEEKSGREAVRPSTGARMEETTEAETELKPDAEMTRKVCSQGGQEVGNHHKEEKDDMSDAAKDLRDSIKHLKLLVEVLDTDLKPMFDLRRDIKQGNLTHIAWGDLWHLFEIGEDVTTGQDQAQVYRVIRWTGGRANLQPPPPDRVVVRPDYWYIDFQADCAWLDTNGNVFTPWQKKFSIPKYDGERALTSLPIFPLAFLKDEAGFRKQLLARGDNWLQLAQAGKSTHKQYTGLTLDEVPTEVDSQIVVDTRLSLRHYFTALSLPPREPPGINNLAAHHNGETHNDMIYPRGSHWDSVHQDYEWDLQCEHAYFEDHPPWLSSRSDSDEIDDEDKILLPPGILGFILRNRRWARFDVELIKDVEYTSGFDSLVLPDGHRETVRALVANHAKVHEASKTNRNLERSIDLVRGKGEGLVILLHGAPGVGKTSTAECVAGNTKRPLFPITCGDIGGTAAEVEENLENSFQLAHAWGCVLLLDEADIFLQKRDKYDIQRNAIVSVFLRTLEYYSGILFLTTNRVGTFDPAFRSRIHISLFYPVLKKEATMKIWKMHLERTHELKGRDLKINNKEILKFAKDHYLELKKANAGTWNGRQIRNAFQTAIALAEYRATEEEENGTAEKGKSRAELSKEHFKIVAQASKDFDLYLLRTLGGQTEADVAKNEQTRLDDFHHDEKARSARVSRKSKKKEKEKVEVDSEESEARDSEDSGDESDVGGSTEDESESESEEEEPVKKSKKKKGRK